MSKMPKMPKMTSAASVNDALSASLVALFDESKVTTTVPYIEAALSCVGEPVQFGLRAACHLPRGTRVAWYGGKLRWSSDLAEAECNDKTHVRRMPDSSYVLDGNYWASRLHRPIPKDETERTAILAWTTEDVKVHCFGDVPASEPLGWLANSPGTSRSGANVAIAYHKIMSGLFTVPYLRATRDIAAGEAILCFYGNEHQHKTHTMDFVSLGNANPPLG